MTCHTRTYECVGGGPKDGEQITLFAMADSYWFTVPAEVLWGNNMTASPATCRGTYLVQGGELRWQGYA